MLPSAQSYTSRLQIGEEKKNDKILAYRLHNIISESDRLNKQKNGKETDFRLLREVESERQE